MNQILPCLQKVATIFLLSSGLLPLTGCVTPGINDGKAVEKPVPLPPLPEWPKEEIEVAKIAAAALVMLEPGKFVHLNPQTKTPSFSQDPWVSMSRLEDSTLVSFQRKLQQHCLMPRSGLPSVMEVDWNGGLAKSLTPGHGGWTEYYGNNPSSQGYVEFSRVGLSEDGQQALIYIGHQKHWVEGSGKLLLMENRGLGWKIIDISHLWGT
ncbi:MAG: hypothetical protein ACI8UO_000200 [Verrucomicrobiales bacterium]|jgi:hypothetical protein